MPAPAKPRIFVSHSHQDNDFCREFVRGLRAAGCDVWYDEHNLGWGVLRATIEREMPLREHFVAIFSPPAVASEWVNSEIDAAMELLREGTLRTLTFVLAAPCVIPLLLRRWKRVERPGGVAVSADEAVRRTLDIIAPDILLKEAAPDNGGHSPRPIATQAAAPSVAASVATPRPAPLPIPPERFPARLATLGFAAQARGGVEWIVPPLCPVPAGQFRLGSDKTRDKDAGSDELNRRVVNLAAFEIGRFPVTVAEYACFLRATQRQQPSDWATQRQRLDHPVVYVSWYDAFDYAAWLAERTGQPWRLPTEAEWEKAARSDHRDPQGPLGASSERLYPWGDTFDKARCNTRESGQRTTSPVGWYGPDDPDPRAGRQSGASPCGAEELAGNVWEWTATEYVRDYSKSELTSPRNSTSNRCLRGGSWLNVARYARAAYRGEVQPGVANDGFGFRLVLASLTHSTQTVF